MSDNDLDSIRFFENRSGKHEILLPDQIFLLHAPLDVLIGRNSDRTSEKSKFNETVLTRYYGDFEHTMATLPVELSEKTICVDSTKSILEVNISVRARVSELTGKTIVEGNFSDNPERR
ncbi:MAG: hypothetical protein AAB535_01685 [Patescibacteria group bacterium]